MRADEPVQFLELLAARVVGYKELRRQAGQCAVGNDGKPLLGGNLVGKCTERRLIDFEG